MLGSRDVDDLDLSDDDELDSSNGDAEADALLEEMRKMNAQAAAACATIDGSTKTNDTLADELHTKLGKSVLSIIEDVASGNVSDEAATDIAATSSSQQPSEGLLLKPSEAAMLSELEASAANVSLDPPPSASSQGSYSAVDMLASGRDTASSSNTCSSTKGSRFGVSSSILGSDAPAARATVSDISRLASKPLISDDWAPPPRRPGAGGGRSRAAGRGGGSVR